MKDQKKDSKTLVTPKLPTYEKPFMEKHFGEYWGVGVALLVFLIAFVVVSTLTYLKLTKGK